MKKEDQGKESKKKFDGEVERWTGLYHQDDKVEKTVSWGIFQRYVRKRVLQRKEICLDQLHNVENKRILEIGCGGGYYGIELLKRKSKWYGLDISYSMLQHCQKMLEMYHFEWHLIQGDVLNLSVKKNAFDMILCIGVLSYFNEAQAIKIFDNIHNCLESDGKLITQTMAFDPFTWMRSRLPAFVFRPLRLVGPLRSYHCDRLRKILVHRGFIVEKMIPLKKYGFIPAGWIYVTRKA